MLEIKENELMGNHTSFRIGGPARYFVVVKNPTEAIEAIDWAQKINLDFKIIGGGSNLLVADSGYQGLIIKYFGGEIVITDDIVEVGAGVPLVKVMHETLRAGLIGLEWAMGIPGTIGGATCNNAGAYGGEMSQNVISVKVLVGKEIKELGCEDCHFSYRHSAFKSGEIRGVILSVKLKLRPGSADELSQAQEKINKILIERRAKFAHGPSAGSVFKNIIMSEEEIIKFKEKFPQLPEQFIGYRKIPAAWLIDECDLKGKQVGGVKVSDSHAGIIINTGEATAEQVIMMISIIKQKVRSRFSVQLMEEIEYLGF